MTQLLKNEDRTMVLQGYGYTVDNGYSKIETLEQLTKAIGRMAAECEREERVAEIDGIKDEVSAHWREGFQNFAKWIEMRLA